jgi:prepilin-type N-terminal cleavage/methylation domain-containing protein
MNVPSYRPPRGLQPPAFTLIELLIVVAIIAILAASAVVNFLEAQTRAKAARARADLRSIATALEMYHVDERDYPTMIESGSTSGPNPVGIPQLYGSDLKWWYTPNVLSTPVAYLTNADILCPFGGDQPQSQNFPDRMWRRYSFENVHDLEAKYLAGFDILQFKYAPDKRASQTIGRWRILCIGPDIAWNPMVQYDPTNGTTSQGNLMRTQLDPTGGAFY